MATKTSSILKSICGIERDVSFYLQNDLLVIILDKRVDWIILRCHNFYIVKELFHFNLNFNEFSLS